MPIHVIYTYMKSQYIMSLRYSDAFQVTQNKNLIFIMSRLFQANKVISWNLVERLKSGNELAVTFIWILDTVLLTRHANRFDLTMTIPNRSFFTVINFETYLSLAREFTAFKLLAFWTVYIISMSAKRVLSSNLLPLNFISSNK